MTQALDVTSLAGKAPPVERRAPLVVVGAGQAGIAAATDAARAGIEVLLIDEHPVHLDTMAMDVPLFFGQRMGEAVRNRPAMLEQVVRATPELAEAVEAGVEVQLATAVWGAFRPGPTLRELDGPVLGLADERRSWLVGYDRLVVAAGARDLALGFPGWEKAGVMGANAAHALLARYGALASRRMVILGAGTLGLRTAALAIERGIEVAGVVEVSAVGNGDLALRRALEARGVSFYESHTVKAAEGGADEVESVVLVGVDRDLRPVPASEIRLVCDTVCLAIGLVPSVELLELLGCRLVFRGELGGFVPEVDASMRTTVPEVWVAGDCAGAHHGRVARDDVARAEGRLAGLAAAASLGAVGPGRVDACQQVLRDLDDGGRPGEGDGPVWLRSLVDAGGRDVTTCRCEEVTRREVTELEPPRYLGWRSAPPRPHRLRDLVDDGPVNQDQVKRLTRVGMGYCQGRRCREQVALLLAAETGTPVDRIPMPTWRPPVRPIPLAVLWPQDEPALVREHWVGWFGIPGQFAPHWQPRDDAAPGSDETPLRHGQEPLAGRVRRTSRATGAGAAVVIVGGGVTGLSAGWWLARAGVDVLVLDKGIVGWEASGRNGGGATHVYSPLGLEEQRLWPQMDELLGYPTEYEPHRIRVALDAEQLAWYRRNAEFAAERGFRFDPLDARQLRELVPIVGDNAVGGFYLHFGGHANPQRTVQAYAWALQDHGGRVWQHATVTGFETAGGRVTAVVTSRGTVGADAVVLAAGPHTGILAARLGVSVPLASARAEMIVTEPLPLMVRGGVDGNGLYGRQTRRGNLVYGGGPHEWVEVPDLATPPHPSAPLLRNLARRLAELFPRAAHLCLIRSWAGIVENTPDGLPVIDRLRDPDNVVVATMSSVGFGLSPAAGRAIGELVLHGGCRFADLSALRLDRFADLPPDWRERQGWVPGGGLSIPGEAVGIHGTR